MPVSRVRNLQDLIALLDEDKAPHRVLADLEAVQVKNTSGLFDGHLTLRFERTFPYCQIVQPMIAGVPEELAAAIQIAVNHVNHGIALPGFGYDPKERFVYFRLCVPLEPEGMKAGFFRAMAYACMNNARDFLECFRRVILGGPPEKALEGALEVARKAKAAAVGSAYEG
jgi:hypothetical protein